MGETISDTVVVKDHYFGETGDVPSEKDVSELYSAVILIVRNPYHTMVSEWQRRRTNRHVGVVDVETMKKGQFFFVRV